MRVLVTRPASQAHGWVARLRERGIDAVALPLIGVEPAADAQPVHEAWAQLASDRLVVFVSPNAVEHFFTCRPAGTAWPAATLAGSPGPGTTRALLDLGVPAACIVEPAADAPQFDSEALWEQLSAHDWRAAAVLIVRGDGGRDWLAATLRQHGAQVRLVGAYRRAAPRLNGDERRWLDEALQRPADHVWFFSSSQAIDHLADLTSGLSLPNGAGIDWAPSRAVATHPRIAQRARSLGFGRVDELRPAFEAVVEGLAGSIQSMPL